jgi:flagellar biosynthesis chaperone FliJ
MNLDNDDTRLHDPLKLSGIIDSYEYVLRKLVEEGLPKYGVYDKCADLVLEYKELVLKNNILAKKAQSLFELQKLEEKKVEEEPKEIVVQSPITLTSRLDEDYQPKKLYETNIDELMKNRLNLMTRSELNNVMNANRKGYGSYATFVEDKNDELRKQNFKINMKLPKYEFISLEDIEKGNYDHDININFNYNSNINDMNNMMNNDNNNVNLNSDTEFLEPPQEQRMNTNPSRKNTQMSKSSKSESISSKSITPSQASKIKKTSKDIVNDLMTKKKK